MDIIQSFVEITLKQPDDFLKIRETLSRIGIASKREKKLYQSCHILHKQGKYYLVHFKELFKLDGKPSDFNQSETDIARRNSIANLLSEWGLCNLVEPAKTASPTCSVNTLKILSYKEKGEWILETKYNVGNSE
tara:strand:+ start:8612 stop:9013 length:402 start_codon:yes stop_codon:yes gene_type:complete